MKLENQDLVSIIIPFFNEEHYFDDCIQSVLNQTYQNLEIIIIDDGSNKKFYKKLRELKQKYPNKINLFHKQNEGVSSARNLGIKEASGKYISFLDADDFWFPNKIEHQLNVIKEKNLDFIHCSYYIIDTQEKIIGKFLSKPLNYHKLIKSCDIGLSTVMMSAKISKENLFPDITTKEDFVCWLNIVKKINILHGDDEALVMYRKKNKSLSSNFLLKFINAFKVYNVYEKFNFLKSIQNTIRLSFHFLLKEYRIRFKNIYPIKFKYILDFNRLKFDKSFIFVALNMASLSYINLLYLDSKNIIFWIDGVCSKFIIKNYKKTAGRKIIEKLHVPNEIKNFYLCGKESKNQINYIQSKFKRGVNFIKLPFFQNIFETSKFRINIDDNSIVFLNISTPKQEIIAKNILRFNKNKKIFIFCLGGGLAMAAGEEEIVPDKIESLNLEWLWRLKTDTFFRLKRLFYTASIFFYKKISNFFKKIIFEELN
ncbi:glycosyltransferase [Candidatus Pelagibacter sp.]|uniref:glycosyltransferase family 2 protein n=1 Tax=Candidatus Pelagibacter sp. TaxID=2024849 RepID=UPI003F85A55F